MLRYLTARSVLTLQVANLFWDQQADSSFLCDTSVFLFWYVLDPASAALWCIEEVLKVTAQHCCPAAVEGGEVSYGFIVLQHKGSKSSSEVLRQICIMPAVLPSSMVERLYSC